MGSDGVGVDVAVGGDDAVSGGGAGDGGAGKRECNGSDCGKAREGYESARDGQVGVVDGGHGGVDDGSDGGVDERGDICSSSRQICPSIALPHKASTKLFQSASLAVNPPALAGMVPLVVGVAVVVVVVGVLGREAVAVFGRL